MRKIAYFQADKARHEDIIRLCKYLRISPETNWDKQCLINWLVYVEGAVEPKRGGGWSGYY